MTTITDSFDRADNTDITTGGPLTWTETSGDLSIVSNKLNSVANTSTGRAETDLATADHYAQANFNGTTISSSFPCVCVRFSASAVTAYVGGATTVLTNAIQKLVAGTATTLANGTNFTTINQVIRLGVTGSSLTLSGATDGTVATVTDTAITGNTRTGVYGAALGASRSKWNDFEAGDLATTTLIERHFPRGAYRGAFRGAA